MREKKIHVFRDIIVSPMRFCRRHADGVLKKFSHTDRLPCRRHVHTPPLSWPRSVLCIVNLKKVAALGFVTGCRSRKSNERRVHRASNALRPSAVTNLMASWMPCGHRSEIIAHVHWPICRDMFVMLSLGDFSQAI